MFLKSNFGEKPSLVKPIIIAVAVIVLIGGAYAFFGKKSDEKNNKEDSNKIELNSSGIDKDQRVRNVGDVEEVMAKWIDANPQAIIASVTNMQRKAMEDQTKNAQKNIGPKKDELFNDSNSPAYSPSGYNISIVEFFDYNCGYCKKTNEIIEALIKSDAKVRVVYKEFPILGPSSEELSSIAIAVNIAEPASYRKFHNALMTSHAASKAEALQVAKNVGINVAKIEATLKSQKSKIDGIINANRTLGASIGVQGTPGFVIGDELIPGASSVEALQQKINEHRKKD